MSFPEPKSTEGETITLGGQKIIFVQLPPRHFRKTIPMLQRVAREFPTRRPDASYEDLSEEKFDKMIELLVMSLTCNYPDLTADHILDLPCKPKDIFNLFPLIAQMSGLELEDKKDDKPGEVSAGTGNGSGQPLSTSLSPGSPTL